MNMPIDQEKVCRIKMCSGAAEGFGLLKNLTRWLKPVNLIYFFSSTNYIKSDTCLLTITQCLFIVCIYILYIDFDHNQNNSYFNFED